MWAITSIPVSPGLDLRSLMQAFHSIGSLFMTPIIATITIATINTTTTTNMARYRIHPARQDGHDDPRRIHTYENRTLPARRIEGS
jgi:hypothetical protein